MELLASQLGGGNQPTVERVSSPCPLALIIMIILFPDAFRAGVRDTAHAFWPGFLSFFSPPSPALETQGKPLAWLQLDRHRWQHQLHVLSFLLAPPPLSVPIAARETVSGALSVARIASRLLGSSWRFPECTTEANVSPTRERAFAGVPAPVCADIRLPRIGLGSEQEREDQRGAKPWNTCSLDRRSRADPEPGTEPTATGCQVSALPSGLHCFCSM